MRSLPILSGMVIAATLLAGLLMLSGIALMAGVKADFAKQG